MDVVKVGKYLSSRRKERGLTQERLATSLGVTHQAVSKWENGTSLPDAGLLLELSSILETSVEEILRGEAAPNTPDSTVQSGPEPETSSGDFDEVVRLAPFVSDTALSQMVTDMLSSNPVEVRHVVALAPFLTEDALVSAYEHLKRAGVDTLRKLAPFLPTEFLDAEFARHVKDRRADESSRSERLSAEQ